MTPLTPFQIESYGKQCRELHEQGASLRGWEPMRLRIALATHNSRQIEELIETLKTRINKDTNEEGIKC